MSKSVKKSKEDQPIKKNANKKKFKKKSNFKKKDFHNIMPLKSCDYSKNWKHFLELEHENKNKNDSIKTNNKNVKEKTSQKSNPNKKNKSRKRKHSSDETQSAETNPIWFDGVDPILLQKECQIEKKIKLDSNKQNKLIKENKGDADAVKENVNITKHVALDCEMVGVGIDGKESTLARVSLVNSLGDCIYDQFVKPKEKVIDYRTEWSGIRPADLKNASDYETVQKQVADILKDRILVGHALHNDLKVLMLSHSRKQVRDTALYAPFRELMKTKRPALRKLVAVILNETIQSGEHSSVIDARATMKLYQLHKKNWEKSLRTKFVKKPKTEIFMGKVNHHNKSKTKKKAVLE